MTAIQRSPSVPDIAQATAPRLALGPAATPMSREIAEYIPVGDDQIYTVLHESQIQRRGLALVAGGFGGERERGYLTLVHWARRLAAIGFDVLRFDYRGMGESTGAFEHMTLSNWREDVIACCRHLRERDDRLPLLMHGMRLGAVLASEAFNPQFGGNGDALLLWGPPQGGREHLWELLRKLMMVEMTARPEAARRTREEYVAQIEAGEALNVDGYFWTRKLWDDSSGHSLYRSTTDDRRPRHAIDVKTPPQSAPQLAPDQSPPTVVRADRPWDASGMITPDNTALFEASLHWLSRAVPPQRGAEGRT